jgi:hypothetical protein
MARQYFYKRLYLLADFQRFGAPLSTENAIFGDMGPAICQKFLRDLLGL